MSILKVLTFPDSKLRIKAKEVSSFDEDLKKLSEDMLETMYHNNGIGLAATQVNIHKRVVVMDLSEKRNQPVIMINPTYEVISKEKISSNEGCLSVPNESFEIARFKKIKIKAFDLEAQEFEFEAEDLLGVCIQHEYDHLDGKLFIDYLSSIKKARLIEHLKKENKLNVI